MILEVNKPMVSSERWMGCLHTEEEIASIQKLARIQNEEGFETSSATTTSTTAPVFKLLLLSFASFLVFEKFWVRFSHSIIKNHNKQSTAIHD